MSSPEPSGRSRPLRIAGLALLGLAVGAAIVGLISLGDGPGGDGGNGGGTAAPGSSAPGSPGSGSSGPGSPGTGSPSASSPGSSAAPTVPPTTQTPPPPASAPTSAAPPAPPPPPPVPQIPVRVYNNSTITGLATQAADDFRRAGWNVVEVANYRGLIPTSTVYFRPGTDEEAAAPRLGNRFNLRVEPRFSGIANASPGLIVIVTNDYGSK